MKSTKINTPEFRILSGLAQPDGYDFWMRPKEVIKKGIFPSDRSNSNRHFVKLMELNLIEKDNPLSSDDWNRKSNPSIYRIKRDKETFNKVFKIFAENHMKNCRDNCSPECRVKCRNNCSEKCKGACFVNYPYFQENPFFKNFVGEIYGISKEMLPEVCKDFGFEPYAKAYSDYIDSPEAFELTVKETKKGLVKIGVDPIKLAEIKALKHAGDKYNANLFFLNKSLLCSKKYLDGHNWRKEMGELCNNIEITLKELQKIYTQKWRK